MIPADLIAEWRAQTRWATDEQVEQDLVLCRALVTIFEDAELAGAVALRGGTALHKLHFSPSRRYSEDIDLVQLRPGPFGPIIDRLRARLDPWLGEPKREQGQGVRLIYRFESEIPGRPPLIPPAGPGGQHTQAMDLVAELRARVGELSGGRRSSRLRSRGGPGRSRRCGPGRPG